MTDLDRRAFFKRSISKASQSVVKYADKKVTQNATRWIRPPYAMIELDFIPACTRCGDCISACEYGVLFALSSSYGGSVMNTPAMDLKNKGCHLCADWPCVTSCEPAALKFPETDDLSADSEDDVSVDDEIEVLEVTPPLPKLAMAKISTDSCLPYMGPECGACRSSCPVEGALSWDLTRPVIDSELCCGCGLCRQACITDPSSITIHHRSTSS